MTQPPEDPDDIAARIARRAAAAKRQRLCRKRRRDGEMVLPGRLAVPDTLGDSLVESGFLPREHADDPQRVRDALLAMAKNVHGVVVTGS